MILIPEQSLFVLGEGGQRQSYDFNGLCADLRTAFERNGVKDNWLIDQFTLTVEERLRGQAPMREGDIDTLLSSVLTASGYGDVAVTFMELRGADPLRKFEADLKAWDENRLQEVLRSHLPLSSRQLETLKTRCSESLRQLRITAVSDTFIRELGIHLLYGGKELAEEKTVAKRETSEGDWKAACSPRTLQMLEQRVFSVYPAAPLFPRPRIAFDLSKYSEHYAHDWESELSLGAGLPEVADCGLEIIANLRKRILMEHPDFTDCPGHVVIPRYAEFLEHYPSESLRERRGFDRRLRRMLEANFVSRTDFEVMLSYR